MSLVQAGNFETKNQRVSKKTSIGGKVRALTI